MPSQPPRQIVLMYHGIVSPDCGGAEGREIGAGLYDVSLEDFQRQMGLVAQAGGTEKVVLTFDDGEYNNFQNALPVLKEFGFRAYFFVTVNRVGQKGYMGWGELEQLRDSAMIIGSHGLNHQSLTRLSDREVENELRESKRILENNLRITIEDFSVPKGFYHQGIVIKAKEAGYKNVFVSEALLKDDGCIGRVAVKGSWSLGRFEQALRGRRPFGERIFNFSRKTFRCLFGEGGYERVRSVLLRGKR